MSMFQKATKAKAKLRLALCGTAGTGKTYSSLAIASELVPGGRIAVIDSERGSASLYADKFSFDTLNLETHSPDVYVEAIKAAESEGYDVVIVDSLSHAWAGKDGALEKVDKVVKRSTSNNSFTAWREVTPLHNRLIDTLISSSCHVIATMRSKTEWILEENARGQKVPKRVGMEPIMRSGVEYEFTVVGDINLDHQLVVTKTRCQALTDAVIDKPGAQIARTLREWLAAGVEAPVRAAVQVAAAVPPPAADPVGEQLDEALQAFLNDMTAAKTAEELAKLTSDPRKPAKGAPHYDRAIAHYKACKAALEKRSAA